ncbi:rRNA maturation RNase YbeY [Sphingobacteriales bacterium CHB3]|nr:rRNA maturation RNase YbeY [Sphingobacteriales bacterium CHB3]
MAVGGFHKTRPRSNVVGNCPLLDGQYFGGACHPTGEITIKPDFCPKQEKQVRKEQGVSAAVTVINAHRRYRIPKKRIARYVQRVIGKKKANITVIFIDSRYSKAINRRYLNHNFTTDVISFALESTPVLEGEIYVNLDRAKMQAREYGVSFSNEAARLVIHGALHLIGYDDTTTRKRRVMKNIEDMHVQHWFPLQKGNAI